MQTAIYRYLVLLLCSCALTAVLIPFFIWFAHKTNLLDKPDGKIKLHNAPVPHFGGLAIFVVFFTMLACFSSFHPTAWHLITGLFVLLVVGLVDDMKILLPWQKFLGQFLAVICFLQGGLCIKNSFFSSKINLFFSSFWMLLIINAFNLIDVMDGLTATTSLCAGLSFFIIAVMLQQHTVAFVLAVFLGAILGFFIYNKPPASVYLGDAGALFIGGLFAAIPILLPWRTYSDYGYCAPVIILCVPLLELGSLIIIRFFKGIPFWHGSPDHFAIYLQNKGWLPSSVLLFVAIAAIVSSGVSFLFFFGIISLAITCCFAVIFLLLWFYAIFSGAGNVLPALRAICKKSK